MKSVLFIQDQSPWIPIVNQAFNEGFALTRIGDLASAGDLLSVKDFDIVLVDSKQSDMLSFPIAVRRKHKKTVFVYLGSRVNTAELVKAFDADYDEVLALPLEPVEIRLRLAARFKDRPSVPSHDCVWIGALRLNVHQQRVVQTGAQGERELELTPNEFRIFYALATREQQTLSREQILKEAWGGGLHVEARTVDKHVCALRRKLGSYARALVSVAGKGYLFDSKLVDSKQAEAPVGPLSSHHGPSV